MILKVDLWVVLRVQDVERLAKTLYISEKEVTFALWDGSIEVVPGELLNRVVRKAHFYDLILLRNEPGSGYVPPPVEPPPDPVDPTDPPPEQPPLPPAEPDEEEIPPEDQLEDSFPTPDGTEEEEPIPDEDQLEDSFPTPPTDELGGPWPDTSGTTPTAPIIPSEPNPPAGMSKATAFTLDAGDTDTITPSSGLWNVVRGRFNAIYATELRISAELWFRYLGDPSILVPLTDASIPKRVGLILRSADPCNLVALFWDFSPNDGIKVAVKTNAGLNTFAACGDGGFTFVTPSSSSVPALPVFDGTLHRLRWELVGTTLTVKVNDVAMWVGTLPSPAFDIVGPLGVTANNAKFQFTLWVPLPDNTPPPVRIPSAPQNLAATPSDGVVSFDWDGPTDLGTAPLESFVLEVFNATNGVFVSRTIDTWRTTKQIAHINGITYRARIAAISAAGTGTFSALSAPYTPTQTLREPTAPQNLTVLFSGDHLVALQWENPIDLGTNTPTSSLIEIYDAAGNLLLSRSDVWGLSAQITGLTNKVAQHARVACVSAAGRSPFSTFSPFFTPDAPLANKPGSPQNLNVVVNDTVAALSWDAPADDGGAALTQWLVQVSNQDTGVLVTQTFGAWALGVSVPNLPVGTPLVFKVAAANSAGTGVLSSASAPFSVHYPYVNLAFHPPWNDLQQHAEGRLGLSIEPGWSEGLAVLHNIKVGDSVGAVLIASDTDKVFQEGDVFRFHFNQQFLAALWPSGGLSQNVVAFCTDAAGGTQPLRIRATPTAGWAVQGFAGTNLHTAQPTDARQWDLQLEVCFSVNPTVGYVSLYDNTGGVYILNKTSQQTMSGTQAVLRVGLPSFGGSVDQGWLHSAMYGDLLRTGQSVWRRILFDGLADTLRIHKANASGSSSYANQVANSALDRAYLVKDSGAVWVKHTVKAGDKAGPTSGPGGQLSELSMNLQNSTLRRQLCKGDEVTITSRFRLPTGFPFVDDPALSDTADPRAVVWRLQQRAVQGASPPFEIVLTNNLLRVRVDGKYWDDLAQPQSGYSVIAQPATTGFVYNVKLLVRFDDDPALGRAELYINDQLVAPRRYMKTILPIASPPYNVDLNGVTITEEMDSIVCGMVEAPSDDPVSGVSVTRSILHGGCNIQLSRSPAQIQPMKALPPPASTPDPVTGPAGMTQVTTLNVTSGGPSTYQIIPGLWHAEVGNFRADYSTEVRSSAELWFTRQGDSPTLIPLGDGSIRRQIGMMLRESNECNVVYLMWHFTPNDGIEVSVKANAGQTTFAQCGDNGYSFVTPSLSIVPPVPADNTQHKLGWAIVGSQLSVYCDGVLSWQGTLPSSALTMVGPVGIRSDNCKYNFNLWVPAPDGSGGGGGGGGGTIDPIILPPAWTLNRVDDFIGRYSFNGDWDEYDVDNAGQQLYFAYDGANAPTVSYEHIVLAGGLVSRCKATDPSKAVLRSEGMTLTGRIAFGCASPSVPWNVGAGVFAKVVEFRDQAGALALSIEADFSTGRLVDSSGAVLRTWTLTKNTWQVFTLSWNTTGVSLVLGGTTIASNVTFASSANPLYLRAGILLPTAHSASLQFRHAGLTMSVPRFGRTLIWQFDSYANGTNVGGVLVGGVTNSATRTWPSIVENGFQDRILLVKVLDEYWFKHRVKSTDLNNGSGPRSEFKMSTTGTQFLKGSTYRSYHEFMFPSDFAFAAAWTVCSKQDHQVGSGNTTTGSSPPLEFDLVNRALSLRLGGAPNAANIANQKILPCISSVAVLTKYIMECEFYMHDDRNIGHAKVKVNGVQVVNDYGRTMMPVTDVSPEVNYCKTGLYQNPTHPERSLYVRRHVVERI